MKTWIMASALLVSLMLAGCGGDPGNSSSTASVIADPLARYAAGRNEVLTADQFEYDFAFTASIKYKAMASALPVTYSGTTQWNKAGAHTNYFQSRSVSIKLFSDEFAYHTYGFNLDKVYVSVNGDDAADFSSRKSEVVASVESGVFEDKSLGKFFLRYLDPSSLSGVSQANNRYQLSIKAASQAEAFKSVLGTLDISQLAKAVSSVTANEWGVGVNANAYVEFVNNSIHLFHVDLSVSKDDFTLALAYDQTYSHIGSGVTISLPTFGNGIVDPSALSEELSGLNTAFVASKAAASSQYDYSLKTAVDHGHSSANPLGLAVNSTSAGTTKRALLNDKVYFDNRLEVDSDYKNKGQYPNVAQDYERYRAKVNDGKDTVYDCIDETFPKANVYTALTNYANESIDAYYLLPNSAYLSADYVKILTKKARDNGGYEYKLGLTPEAMEAILKESNASIRLDPTLATPLDVYQIASDFSAKKISYVVDTNSSGTIDSVRLLAKGFYTMTGGDFVRYAYDLTLTYDWSAKAYVIPTSTSEISLF